MEIVESEAREYSKIIPVPYHTFASAAFNQLNSAKCEKVHYLLFRNNKFRLGIVGGVVNGIFLSPFSAPFGGFVYVNEDIRLQHLEEGISMLESWAVKKELESIRITLPSSIYSGSFLAKQVNCLYRAGFEISEIDLNYFFDTRDFDSRYSENIWYNARKNLRIAFSSQLEFRMSAKDEEKKIAYDIISRNRESRGFPLRMNWDQVRETSEIIPADFFLVYSAGNLPIASAIVFHVSKNIVQVVYWGDLTEYSQYKTMNFLSFKVFEHYKSESKKYIDIGPSTQGSIPNYGLCEFKESIGSRIDLKYTFTKPVR